MFTRKVYKDAVIDCLNFCIQNKGMIVYGYVIMSNHIHLVLGSAEGNLSALIRDFKKFTAKTILEKIHSKRKSRRAWMLAQLKEATESHSRNKYHQFWRYGNHAEEIYSEKFMWSKLNYIHFNPVKVGIVANKSDYVYSSASNYVGKENVLKSIVLVARPVVDVLKAGSFKE